MVTRFLSPLVAQHRATRLKREDRMSTGMFKNYRYTSVSCLFISMLLVAAVPAVQAETVLLFRSPDRAAPVPGGVSRDIPQKSFWRVGEKGDLLIQCGSARFTIASNAPVNQPKPAGQQYSPQREFNTPIIGVSLTASLSF
jgi:hypothetical protein